MQPCLYYSDKGNVKGNFKMNVKVPRKKTYAVLIVLAFSAVLITGCDLFLKTSQDQTASLILQTPLQHRGNEPAHFVQTVNSTTTADIIEIYQTHGVSIKDVLSGQTTIPPVLPTQVPADFNAIEDATQRKTLFLAFMLPNIQAVNATIIAERTHLQQLQKQGEPTVKTQKELDRFAERYGGEATFDSLLKRVDIIPVSLALTQSAIESGWGTSRFAAQGNALFGEHTSSDEYGLQPAGLSENSQIKIEAFETTYDAVASYMLNLNAHTAYEDLRNTRASLRAQDQPLTATALAPSLLSYSERAQAYVDDVLLIITQNNLEALNHLPALS